MSIEIRAKEIAFVPIDSIQPNPKNRNVHSEQQIDALCKIIEYQGFRNPLVISRRSGLLVAGHGRLLAARKLGLEFVPVLYQDFDSDDQEWAAMISDNSIATWAELDLSGIHEDLPNFTLPSIDLLGIQGFQFEPPAPILSDADLDKADEHWQDLPVFNGPDARIRLVITFPNEEERKRFFDEQKIPIDSIRNSKSKLWSLNWPIITVD